MQKEDKTAEIVKAVKAKHEASRKKTEYILPEGWVKKDKTIYFKEGTILKLTPANYEALKAKGIKMKKV